MTADQFVFWLQGLFELSDTKTLDASQVKIIKEHLDLVFEKVTPAVESQANIDFTAALEKAGFRFSPHGEDAVKFEPVSGDTKRYC
jgi:hypothetical protein